MDQENRSNPHIRVIIAGGSIAGLTLAHCLHHANIDYVVLEARKEIAPQIGASIVIMPNGARILDQLGLYDDILALSETVEGEMDWTGEGKLLVTSDGPSLTRARLGYPLAFLQRCNLLQVLAGSPLVQSKILCSKRVVRAEHKPYGITVHCEDGSQFEGHILVGADGIHSTVRKIMQGHIEQLSPCATRNDTNSISAEYNCLFGITDASNDELQAGIEHRSYAKDFSTVSFVREGGKLFWFLFSKLDKRYYGKDIPRYQPEDAQQAAKAFFNINMTDTIKYEEIWKQRTMFRMTCIEEAQHEHWTSDRIVCLGDAIHKMTPNLGAGGNAAIESAAALANSLCQLRNRHPPELFLVRRALKEFHNKSVQRANAVSDATNELTRIETWATLRDKFIGVYATPNLGDLATDEQCNLMVGAERLNFLPLPERSLSATMPWSQKVGVGKHENKYLRAFHALSFLLFIQYATKNNVVIPDLKVSGYEWFDKLLSNLVSYFMPALSGFDPAKRVQAIGFIGDLIPVQAIFMIEAARRGNFLTVAHLLPLFLAILSQVFGPSAILPIYYAIHYIQTPLENYHAADNRMTQIGTVKIIIPTILLSYILPSIAMFTDPGFSNRLWINGVFWQPFPIYAQIIQMILGSMVKDTTVADRIQNPEADMPYLRRVYVFAATVAAVTAMYTRFHLPGILPSAASCAGLYWIWLHFTDLKVARKLNLRFVQFIGVLAGLSFTIGPSATTIVMWAWREELLAARKGSSISDDGRRL